MNKGLPFGTPEFRRKNAHLFGQAVPKTGAVADESELHNEIIEYCKDRRWLYFHGSMAHETKRTPGEPDFEILADRGRVFFVECKSKDGKLSTDQRAVIQWAAMLGHTVHVVVNMDEFRRIVE